MALMFGFSSSPQLIYLFVTVVLVHQWSLSKTALYVSCRYISAIGDPEMKSPNVRMGLEAWNFCNEVGFEAPNMGSPRLADCSDFHCSLIHPVTNPDLGNTKCNCKVYHKVQESDNRLGAGDEFPLPTFQPLADPDLYAAEKELYLGSRCQVCDSGEPWQFWMIMLKNGNFDKNSTLCPEDGKKVSKIVTDRKFPCFGKGCMNQPLVYHNQSEVVCNKGKTGSLHGGFYGTYDLDAKLSEGVGNSSYFSISWRKNLTSGSWIIAHLLKTSSKYPWLMLYLRADAARGFNGGYHYNGTGILRKLPESPKFKVKLTLDIKQGGGPNSQFYLVDIGSCWKNDGLPCNGDVLTDVTRYSEMIINPETKSWCRPDNLVSCPPYHVSPTGEIIHRNNTSRFPYSAYHLYCGPGNADFPQKPFDACDPYSNPQSQEILQLLPHSEWAVHGYPEKQGDGWVGDARTWILDVGALSARLYFYQDPGTKPARRIWTSINVGTEIYVSPVPVTAEWTVSDFDVLVDQDD